MKGPRLRADELMSESPEIELVEIETCDKDAMSAFDETVLNVNDVVKLNDEIVTSANEVLGAPIGGSKSVGEEFEADVVRFDAIKSITEECAVWSKIAF